jgi:hypothetical protein
MKHLSNLLNNLRHMMPTNCVTGSQGGIHNGHSPPHLSREISEGLPPTPSFHGPQPPVPTSSVTNYNTETHDGLKTNVLDPLSNPGGFSSQLPLEASDRGSEHEILSLEGEANQITLKPAPSRIVPWAKPISPLSPISPLQSSVSLGGDEQSTDIARDLFWTQPLAHIQSLDGLDAPVTAMAFSPERSLFAVGLEYGRVDIWRLDPDSNLMLLTAISSPHLTPSGNGWRSHVQSYLRIFQLMAIHQLKYRVIQMCCSGARRGMMCQAPQLRAQNSIELV